MPHSNELTRSKCYEIFSQSTGVEIRPAARSHKESGDVVERSGRIQLRFFKLLPKANPDDVTQIRFICEPDEAFELYLKLSSVASSPTPCKEKLNPHKFSTGDPAIETVTTVTAEKWERNGKSGYALTVGRGRDFISVPVPLSKILFAAEFLRYLSTDQCWVERQDKAFSEKLS
ncbi:MAG: hypothetical protein RW306_00140 [Geobacteraceae bacterium]|nr:hypothetical protein [Geobacteraceae bacterium]